MTTQEELQRAVDLANTNAANIAVLTKWVIGLTLLITIYFLSGIIHYFRVLKIYRRVELLLTMTETHGGLTDQRAKEVKAAVVAGTKGIAAVVTKTGEEVKKEVKEVKAVVSTPPPSESGTTPVVPPVPAG